ncbi:MAG: DUF1492 domain-containing protein [Roseburia sp.]|nr:DUF1492 domain-containing protein [Roseburia sp.]
MTLHELSQLFKLMEQLRKDEEMMDALRTAACPGAQVLTGMPHAPGVRDKVGDLAVEIADLQSDIDRLNEQIAAKQDEVQKFIATIANAQTRMVFRLRFLRGLTWEQVAVVLGGRNTEDGVKKICYRYLDSLGVDAR